MALDVRVDSFAKQDGTGDQTITVGFQPKAIKLWVDSPTVFDTWITSSIISIGVATSPANQFCVPSFWINNGSGVGKLIIIADENANVIAQGRLKEITATGFVIDWEINNFSNYIICYEAIGGSDLTGAFVAHDTSPGTTGSFDITGAPFTPTFAYFLHSGGPIGTSSDEDDPAIPSELGVGCSDGISQWAVNCGQLNRIGSFSDCIIKSTAASDITKASFVQFNSDGCSVNFTAMAPGAFDIVTLFLQGPAFKVGRFAKSTSLSLPASQAVSGIGLTPKLVSFSTVQLITEGIVTADGMLSVGAADGTRARVIARTGVVANRAAISRVLAVIKANSPAAEQAIASFTSMNATGFTISWLTNDAVATWIYYIAIGTSGSSAVKNLSSTYQVRLGAPGVLKPSTYRISASIAKTFSSTYRVIATTGDVEVTGYGGRRYGTQWGECARCGFFYPFPLLIVQPGFGGGATVCIVRCLDQPSADDLLPDELPTEQPLQFIGDAGPEE